MVISKNTIQIDDDKNNFWKIHFEWNINEYIEEIKYIYIDLISFSNNYKQNIHLKGMEAFFLFVSSLLYLFRRLWDVYSKKKHVESDNQETVRGTLIIFNNIIILFVFKKTVRTQCSISWKMILFLSYFFPVSVYGYT